MKRSVLGLLIGLAALPAIAQHHGHRNHHGHGHWHWGHFISSAVVGAVVYDIYNRPVIVQQPPVILQSNPIIIRQPMENCTSWMETQNPDGSITRTRTCSQ